ncbi:MAG: TonB-dependent receptor [Flavobacteriia bacterium]|nr:TonB-dependent receptor [Flavobacteriia bacterium]
MAKRLLLLCFALSISAGIRAQVLTGVVVDESDNQPIPSIAVLEVGQTSPAVTNFDGEFTLRLVKLPTQIVIEALGYKKKTLSINSVEDPLNIRMEVDQQMIGEVSVVERRLSERQAESALTVEALDLKAIQETPSASFYDGLGNLKGVDLTSASIGFKVINTRGFNSTSPVRSLQLIDNVDNQAPGLNFSLGNFLGASELDVMNVDIVAGASSAFYGPNAFNGVIAMTTKDPFIFQGLDFSAKVGERRLNEYAVRWADAFGDRDGEPVFAYKINLYYLSADDWEATNYDATDESPSAENNPGGYDAVNRYGDERGYVAPGSSKDYPALGTYHREGIEEIHLVDYDTRNLKLGTSLHYRATKDIELIYAFNFGTGTTVYQGDNRYSLKDILFFQNRVEVRDKNKWFVRLYSTNEDAGNSYDAYFTALRMQDSLRSGLAWSSQYAGAWRAVYADQVRNLPGYPDENLPQEQYDAAMVDFIDMNRGQITEWHNSLSSSLQSEGATPGTEAFDELYNYITTTSFAEGGSMFEDRSSLYHAQAEYKFDPNNVGTFTIGGNGRLYRPNSNGTIFSDTAGRVISNWEYGIYGGWQRNFNGEQWKLSATLRMDKNENFDYLFSPAVSAVYNVDERNIIRFSVSSAIRNPTLQDQYLYYNVGPARLIGNLNGYDSLITADDFQDYLALPSIAPPGDPSRTNYEFDYFSIDPIRPERVRTVELGYRTTLWKSLYVDANYYYSFYEDFIGYQIALDINEDQIPNVTDIDVYRIATNARDLVTTQGFSIGLNYYFWDNYSLAGNYTWNVLNTATDDPIIPAFNTPEHKYNVSFSGSEIPVKYKDHKFGFNVTYKWVQGFLFEGSPQFTGFIDDYALLDAQVTYIIPEWNLTTKLGASNILNNQVFQVYGGPRVGRLAYISFLYSWGPNR